MPGISDDLDMALLVGGLLTAWSACVYLATGWRGRIRGETRARVKARNTIDPLTGLATPLVLSERVEAARHLTRRYGHPSVLMLVHIENPASLAHEFGPEAAESAVLAAAARVREALLRDGDVVARLTHTRMGVLAGRAWRPAKRLPASPAAFSWPGSRSRCPRSSRNSCAFASSCVRSRSTTPRPSSCCTGWRPASTRKSRAAPSAASSP
ncbi:GGDEF domain-containing protein [Ramlibacter terrae]|uniref:GGDEF domain-containing protein n=1 Tax=Ramlibacter terrae TaxID=2732511 RepID=A0ABX6P4C0_9BURK|nr:GGDEF domain-containing protein [Ramlibacter terrae]